MCLATMADGVAQAFAAARERASAAARAGGIVPGTNVGIEAARTLSAEVDAIIIDVAGREVAKCKTPVAICVGSPIAAGGDREALARALRADVQQLVHQARTALGR